MNCKQKIIFWYLQIFTTKPLPSELPKELQPSNPLASVPPTRLQLSPIKHVRNAGLIVAMSCAIFMSFAVRNEMWTTDLFLVTQLYVFLLKAVVTSYNDGPKPVYVDPSTMRSSWENLPLNQSGMSLHQSTATVNSLHSSSHSSSSNQSTGDTLSLGYALGSHLSFSDRDGIPPQNPQKSVRVGMSTLGESKDTSYSQPFLNNTGEFKKIPPNNYIYVAWRRLPN